MENNNSKSKQANSIKYGNSLTGLCLLTQRIKAEEKNKDLIFKFMI